MLGNIISYPTSILYIYYISSILRHQLIYLIKKKKKSMANEEKSSTRQQRWTLQGMTALVTGGTKGIGYLFNLIMNSLLITISFIINY